MTPRDGHLPDRVPVMCQLALGHYFLHAGLDGMPADEVLATPRSSPASWGCRTW